MDLSSPSAWVDLAHKAATVGLALVIWLRKPGTDALDKLAKHKEAIEDATANLDKRLAVLEERSDHTPTAAEISELRAALEGTRAAVEASRAQLARIENFLMSWERK